MGIIRLCLSLAVVSTHTGHLPPFSFNNGLHAVRIFFVISGFYMALILNEKYLHQTGSYKLFITNRILRLYPIYLIVFILSLMMYMFCVKIPICSTDHFILVQFNPYTYLIQNMGYFLNNWGIFLYGLLSNLFILGLDLVYFMKFTHPHIVPVIIPQSWSLSLEFYFYFMAPFLVRQKTIYLILLFVLSIYISNLLFPLDLSGDSWQNRSFPSNFAFFLLGIFSYRIYTRIQTIKVPKPVFLILLYLILQPILNWNIYLSIFTSSFCDVAVGYCLYFMLLLIGLPVIFLFTKNNTFDRWIGEFSYPIYISHIAVLYFVNHILQTSSKNVTYGWQVALLSFILSYFLLYLFIYPIEKIRAHRVLSHKM